MKLPLLGAITESDHGQVLSYLTGLAQEASDARRPWEILADSNLTIYVHGADPPPGEGELVINEIQNAIIAATDIQTREPPSATLEPVETGDQPDVFFSGPPQIGLQLGLAPQQVSAWQGEDGQSYAPLPLDEQQAAQAQAAIAAGQLPEDFVVEVNDKLISATYQLIFDLYWMRSTVDRWVRSNLLATNIQGWSFALYEFDDAEQKHLLKQLSIRQVHIDPTVEDIDDAAYAGVDQVIDADQAASLYPHLAETIAEEARAGQPTMPDGNSQWGQASDRDFQRPMVVLRTFWLRHQLAPMTPEQALEQGKIEARAIDEPAMSPGPDGQMVVSMSRRQAMYLTGTQTEVTPDAPDWPTRRVLRQITVIANAVVDDRECEHWDIPLLQNVNLPIPAKPWGLGEPYRLKAMQAANSKVVGAMVEHAEYFKAPVTSMSQSMHDALPEEYRNAHVRPGMTFIVPDDQWQASGGRIHNILEPPQTPPALIQLHQILAKLITDQSGHTEVLQGRASSQLSGRAIETLQQAASSMIGFKSQRTGDMIQRLTRLMLHSLVTRLGVAQISRIVSQYPAHILQAIHDRAARLEWDVQVLISSGTGQLRQAHKQEAMLQRQAGAISLQTLREKLGVDHRIEGKRMASEMAQMAPPAQMQAAIPTEQ
jgi:hypothetical protein